MSDEDNIIREVEEDLRRERYERLWKKYGPFVIGTIIVVLVSMVGWQQYQAWQDRQRAREAEVFLAAADLLEEGKEAEAAKALGELAAEAGSGYRAIARFHEAEAHLQQGNPEEALAAFEALAADGSADSRLRALAALKGGLLLADSAAPEDLKKQLAPALRPRSPWRYAAQELIAYAHYRTGERGEALNAYQALVNEYNAPAHIRDRARSMVDLIKSEQAQGLGEEAPGDGAEAASASGAEPGTAGTAEDSAPGPGGETEAADNAPPEEDGNAAPR